MKAFKVISGVLLLYTLLFAISTPFSGCIKTQIERDTMIIRDTTVIRDTLNIHDTTLYNIAEGLVAFYPFNGNTNDESGYGNNISFNNATLAADRKNRPNKAYLFNGISSYMKINNSYYLNPPKISLSVIIKPLGFNAGSCLANSIVYKGYQDQDIYNVYFLRFDANQYTGAITCTSGNPDTLHQNFSGSFAGNGVSPATPYVEKNKWYHLVYTYDGMDARMYINGNLVSTRSGANQYVSSTHDVYIGKTNNPLYPYWFNGVIDELRIYNRAITVDEVRMLSSANYMD